MSESDDLYVGGIIGESQEDPSETLTGDNTEDPLDAGYTPPDRPNQQLARRHRRGAARGRVPRRAAGRGGAGRQRGRPRPPPTRSRAPAAWWRRTRGRTRTPRRTRSPPTSAAPATPRRAEEAAVHIQDDDGRCSHAAMQLTKFTPLLRPVRRRRPHAGHRPGRVQRGAGRARRRGRGADHPRAPRPRRRRRAARRRPAATRGCGSGRRSRWPTSSAEPRRAGRRRRARAGLRGRRASRCATFGGQHALIHPSIPVIANVGYLVDEHGVPPRRLATSCRRSPVDAAAAPMHAPWAKLGRGDRLRRRRCARRGSSASTTRCSPTPGRGLVESHVGRIGGEHGSEYQHLDTGRDASTCERT